MSEHKDGRKGDRREQILRTAEALFLARGLDNVSTREIARAVGISQPSLYAHFESRDRIAVELCTRAFQALGARLRGAVEAGGPVKTRLLRICRTYIDFGLEHDSAYRVAFMLDMSAHETEQMEVLGAGLETFGLLRGLFDELPMSPERRDLAAQSLWAAIHGLVAILLARPEFPFVDRETLIEHHLAVLIEPLCRADIESNAS